MNLDDKIDTDQSRLDELIARDKKMKQTVKESKIEHDDVQAQLDQLSRKEEAERSRLLEAQAELDEVAKQVNEGRDRRQQSRHDQQWSDTLMNQEAHDELKNRREKLSAEVRFVAISNHQYQISEDGCYVKY